MLQISDTINMNDHSRSIQEDSSEAELSKSAELVGQDVFLSDSSIDMDIDQELEARSGDSQFSFDDSCLFSPQQREADILPNLIVEQTVASHDETAMVDTTKRTIETVTSSEETEEIYLELEPGELFEAGEMSEEKQTLPRGEIPDQTPNLQEPVNELVPPAQGVREKKKVKVEFVVVGDSNFSGCEDALPNVLYKKATRYNDLKFRFTNRMNEVSQLSDVKIVVISALQNMIRDAGFANWEDTVDKYILTIAKTAVRKPEVRFVVLGPFLRTYPPEHKELIEPILVRLTIGLAAHPNVFLNSSFEANEKDLQSDGVHLKSGSQSRLFKIVQDCLNREWILKVFSRESAVVQKHDTCSTTTQPMPNATSSIELPQISTVVKTTSGNYDRKDSLPPKSEVRVVQNSDQNQSEGHPQNSPINIHSSSLQRESPPHPLLKDQHSRSRSNRRSPSPDTVANYEYYHRKLYGFAPRTDVYSDYRISRHSPNRDCSKHPAQTSPINTGVSNDPRDVDLRPSKNVGESERRVLHKEKCEIPVTVTSIKESKSLTQTGSDIQNRFAHRLGPKMEDQVTSDHQETINQPARNVVCETAQSSSYTGPYLDGYSDEDEENPDHRQIMWDSFTGEEELSEDDYFRPVKLGKRPKVAKPDKGSAPFVLKDRRAEALCLLKVQTNFLEAYHDTWKEHQDDQTFRMPILTLSQSEEMTKSTSVHACPDFDPETTRVFRPHPSEIKSWFAQNMLRNFNKYRIATVDTEGNFKLKKFKGFGNRLFVSIGDIFGNVYLFLDADDIPDEFRKILEDWRIVKIQSAIDIDIKLFLQIRNPIKVVGWVDTQCLFKAFLHPTSQFTRAEVIIGYFGPDYKKWPLVFDYNSPNLSVKAKMHSVQDSRLPILVLLRSAELRAKSMGYHQDDDIFPIVRLALDLTRNVSKVNTDDLLQENPASNWYPPLRWIKTKPNDRGLNDAIKVTRIQMAQDDYIAQTFSPGSEPCQEDLVQTATRLWMNKKLPSHSATYATNELMSQELRRRCTNCGEQNHVMDKCPSLSTFQDCQYDHCGEEFAKHSITMCPSLHYSCTKCHVRGHREIAHGIRDPLQTKTMFQRHQHLGALTCIPYLALVPEAKHRLVYYHWGLGLYLGPLQNCPGNAYRIGVFEPLLNFGGKTTKEEQARQIAAKCQRSRAVKIAEHNLEIDCEEFYVSPLTPCEKFAEIRRQWELRSHSSTSQDGVPLWKKSKNN